MLTITLLETTLASEREASRAREAELQSRQGSILDELAATRAEAKAQSEQLVASFAEEQERRTTEFAATLQRFEARQQEKATLSATQLTEVRAFHERELALVKALETSQLFALVKQ